MEVGISTASLFLREDTFSSLEILRGMDARVVEIFLESFSEYKSSFFDRLKPYTEGLKVHSLHTVTTQFEPQLFSAVPIQKEDAFSFMREICEGGEKIGAKNYTLHGKAKVKKNSVLNDFDLYARRFNELCDMTEEYGVSVCLENVEWAFYGEPKWFSHIKNECPKLRTCLDVKQARISGYPVEEYIEEMKGRINTVHLSDVTAEGKMVLPGKGITDFGRLFSTLKKAGFCGNMLIEVYSKDYGNVSEIGDSLEYLRKIKREVF